MGSNEWSGNHLKRDTPNHPKTKGLARSLKINRAWAMGIEEALWHFTAQFAPAGDVGRFTDDEIAEACHWSEDAGTPAALVNSLAESRLIDSNPEHRWLVHDWPDHCEDAVHLKLLRAGVIFANGRIPTSSRMSTKEREALAARAHGIRLESAQSAPCLSPSLPSPSLPRPKPKPSPAAVGLADNPDWERFLEAWRKESGGDSGWPMAQQLFEPVFLDLGIERLLASVHAFGLSEPWRNGKIDNMGNWFSNKRYLETPAPAKSASRTDNAAEELHALRRAESQSRVL